MTSSSASYTGQLIAANFPSILPLAQVLSDAAIEAHLTVVLQRRHNLARQHRHVLLPNLVLPSRDSEAHTDLYIGKQSLKLRLLGILSEPPVSSAHQSIFHRCRVPDYIDDILWERRTPSATSAAAGRAHSTVREEGRGDCGSDSVHGQQTPLLFPTDRQCQ